jgi:hypothetical protein
MNPKMKTIEGKGVGVRSLTRSTSRAEGCVGTLRWGLGQATSKSIYSHRLAELKQEIG